MLSLGLGLRLGTALGRLVPFLPETPGLALLPNTPPEATTVGTVASGIWDAGSQNHFVEARMPANPGFKSDVHLVTRYTDAANRVELALANEGQIALRSFTNGTERNLFSNFDYPSLIGNNYVHRVATDTFRLTDHADGTTLQILRSGEVIFERANIPFANDGRPPRTNSVAIRANEDGKPFQGVAYGGARAPLTVSRLEWVGGIVSVDFGYVGDPQGIRVRVEDSSGAVVLTTRDLTLTASPEPGRGSGEFPADFAGQEGKTLSVILMHKTDEAKRGSRSVYVPEPAIAATHGMNDSFDLGATNLFKHARINCNISNSTTGSTYRNAHNSPFMVSTEQAIREDKGNVPLSYFGITDGSMKLGTIHSSVADVSFIIDRAWPNNPSDPMYGLYDIEQPEEWGLYPVNLAGQWERVSGPTVSGGIRRWVFRRLHNPADLTPHLRWADAHVNIPAPERQFVRCIKQGRDRSFLLVAEARAATVGLDGYHRYMNDGGINQGYLGQAAAEAAGRTTYARPIVPADLPRPDGLFWAHPPIEAYGEVCTADGMKLWLCGHGCYTPEAVVSFVQRAKASLPPGRRWGYARSNEVWHNGPAFQQFADCNHRAVQTGRELRHQHCVDSAAHWDAIVAAGLNDDGSGHFIHEWQFSNLQQSKADVDTVLDYPIPSGGTIRSRLASTGFANPGFFGGGLYTGDVMAHFDAQGRPLSVYIDIDQLAAVLDDPGECKTYLLSCLRAAHIGYDRPAVMRINAWLQQGNIEKGFAATAVVQSLYEWHAQNFIFVDPQNAKINTLTYSNRVRELVRSSEFGAFFAEVTEFLDSCRVQAVAFASASPQPFPKDVPAGVPQGTLVYGTFSMADSLALFRVQEPARSYIEKVEALAA